MSSQIPVTTLAAVAVPAFPLVVLVAAMRRVARSMPCQRLHTGRRGKGRVYAEAVVTCQLTPAPSGTSLPDVPVARR